MAQVFGKGKYNDEFFQDTEVEFDASGAGGKFYLDEDKVNDLEREQEYMLRLDDGKERPIRIREKLLSEFEPCAALFDFV